MRTRMQTKEGDYCRSGMKLKKKKILLTCNKHCNKTGLLEYLIELVMQLLLGFSLFISSSDLRLQQLVLSFNQQFITNRPRVSQSVRGLRILWESLKVLRSTIAAVATRLLMRLLTSALQVERTSVDGLQQGGVWHRKLWLPWDEFSFAFLPRIDLPQNYCLESLISTGYDSSVR